MFGEMMSLSRQEWVGSDNQMERVGFREESHPWNEDSVKASGLSDGQVGVDIFLF